MAMKSMLCFALVGLALSAGAAELSGGWRLSADPQDVGRTNGWASAIRADAKPAPVPGVVQQVFPYRDGVAWYYRSLKRPATGPGARVVLSFGAADY